MFSIAIDILSLVSWFTSIFYSKAPLSIPLNYPSSSIMLNEACFSEKYGYDFLSLNNSSDLIDWVEHEIKPSPDVYSHQEKPGMNRIDIPFHNHSCVYLKNSLEPSISDMTLTSEGVLSKLEVLKNLPCLTYSDKYWKFEYCHLRKIKQTEITSSADSPLVYNLGHFFPKDAKSTEFIFNGKVFVMNYLSGDKCSPYAPIRSRSTQVRFTCDPKSTSIVPEISSVFEVSLCHYVISINVPSLCEQSPPLSKESKVPHVTLHCGGLNELINAGEPSRKDETSDKAHAMWIAKVAQLLNSENPHKLLARALLGIHGEFNMLRATHPRSTLNVFAIKAMQQRIEQAIQDLKRRPDAPRREKKRFFITTFTDENDNDDASSKSKKKRKTFKIEL